METQRCITDEEIALGPCFREAWARFLKWAEDLLNTAVVDIDADTDGPDESACVTFGSEQTYNDIWYRYTAPVDGILTISTCNTIDYDSRIAIYTGTCDKLVEYACNDDSTGCTGYSSYLLCHGVAGTEYLVRIGSYNEDNTVVRVAFSPEANALGMPAVLDALPRAGLETSWSRRGSSGDRC